MKLRPDWKQVLTRDFFLIIIPFLIVGFLLGQCT